MLKKLFLVIFALSFVVAGCQKNEEPTGPEDGGGNGGDAAVNTIIFSGDKEGTLKDLIVSSWLEEGTLLVTAKDTSANYLFTLMSQDGVSVKGGNSYDVPSQFTPTFMIVDQNALYDFFSGTVKIESVGNFSAKGSFTGKAYFTSLQTYETDSTRVLNLTINFVVE
jgi:hypothetical protein